MNSTSSRPCSEIDHVIRGRGEGAVVGDDHDRASTAYVGEGGHHDGCGVAVETGRRLIEQEHRG